MDVPYINTSTICDVVNNTTDCTTPTAGEYCCLAALTTPLILAALYCGSETIRYTVNGVCEKVLTYLNIW